ncbi:uncharacterized protein OCT59_025637 [Rhizophagus irregularis]|nr:hypothetical protein OCT59_025637 [Rhizophagus irregularis]
MTSQNDIICVSCDKIYIDIDYKWYGFATAIWKDGLLKYDEKEMKHKRISNIEVSLKCLSNSQNVINEFSNEDKTYSIKVDEDDEDYIPKIYGISKNPDTNDYIIVLNNSYCKECGEIYTKVQRKWCKPCQINNLELNLTNWTSGNKIIDEFIQEMQLKIEGYHNIIVEWIPYNQFNNVKKIGKDGFAKAIWKDGLLKYNEEERKYERKPNKEVTLKCLNNSQNVISDLLNEAKVYFLSLKIYDNTPTIYGISRNPDTNDYIIVLNNSCCKECGEIYTEIDLQLEIEGFRDIIFEWIHYDQFNIIKEASFSKAYLAIWKDGSLEYNYKEIKYERKPNKEVILKCLNNSQNVISGLLNEVKTYSIKLNYEYDIPKIYGISQNPDTKDYIIVLNNNSYCKECGEIYTVVWQKWYKDGFTTAIWKNGLLKYNEEERKYERKPNETTLKCLNDSQNIISDLLNEVKAYSTNLNESHCIPVIYGISRNPDTKNYIIVLNNSYCKECGEIYTEVWQKWCKPCQINNLELNLTKWTSGNKIIDEFIQEMQLKIDEYHNIIFEWIPYNQFNNVKKIGKDGFNTAIWKNGSLEYNCKQIKYERGPNKKVTLKSLNISQNVIGDLLNEVKAYQYSIESDEDYIPKIYGISQNPDTKNYIIVLENSYCKACGEIYTDIEAKWCKGGFATVYLAIWKNGPLGYDKYKKEYNRVTSNKVVALKCLHNSQNITNEFLNEVNAYSISSSFNDHFGIGNDGILKIYGISQNPDTNNYIIVLEYANDGNLNNCNNNIIRNYRWNEKLHVLKKIVKGFKKIHGNNKVHRDFHTGNILVSVRDSIYGSTGNSSSDICISDMGLCGEVSNMDKTKIYGVMPFVAPEVLKGKPYTRAADVYSFAMIMYYIATGRQPFANCAHDSVLALNICNGIRPEINELEAPKFYIDLMKNCWNADPEKRPSAIEIEKLFNDFTYSSKEEIKKQVEKADEYRKTNFLSTGNSQSIHPQACYTSRLLNQFTKELPKHDDTYSISAEIIDFTEYFIEQK